MRRSPQISSAKFLRGYDRLSDWDQEAIQTFLHISVSEPDSQYDGSMILIAWLKIS
jgi:hypothetical protein